MRLQLLKKLGYPLPESGTVSARLLVVVDSSLFYHPSFRHLTVLPEPTRR